VCKLLIKTIIRIGKPTIIIVVLVVLLFYTCISTFVYLSNDQQTNQKIEPSIAQVIWQKTYDGQDDDRIFQAIEINQGYLVVGSTTKNNTNSTTAIAMWIDFNGNQIQNKTYPEGLGTEIRYVINLTDGFLMVGNKFLENGNIDGFILRTNNAGELIWKKTIGSNLIDKIFSATAAEEPHTFILFGTTTLSNGNLANWAVKINIEGVTIWDKNYQIGVESVLRAGIMTPDGNYVAAGYAKQSTEDCELLILKINPDGKLLWNRTDIQQGSRKTYSISPALDGFMIAGDIQSPKTDSDGLVTKFDWEGNMVWSKIVGGSAADSISTIITSDQKNFIVGGFTFSYGAGNRDLWLFQISDNGEILWNCIQGDAGYQEIYQIIESKENQYVVFGWTDPLDQTNLIGKAKYDFNIVKLSPNKNS
jgi:hypothetical protein